MNSVYHAKMSENYIAVPPGETIKEQLEYRNMSEAEFAKEMGMSERNVIDLLEGDIPLTNKIAARLEKVLGIDAPFWNRYEAYYREILAKVEAENKKERERKHRLRNSSVRWKSLPVASRV